MGIVSCTRSACHSTLFLVLTILVSTAESTWPLHASFDLKVALTASNVTVTNALWKPNPAAKGFGARLTHLDAPSSPFRKSYTSEADKWHAYSQSDQSRAHKLDAKMKLAESFSGKHGANFTGRKLLDFSQTLSLGSAGVYFVEALLGTPKQRTTLIFDTGSDLTWTKCMGKGKRPPIPIFKPSSSRTIKNVFCSEKLCRNQVFGSSWTTCYKKNGAKCPFSISYFSGSTGGLVYKDRIVIRRTKGRSFVLSSLVFGCVFGTSITEGIAGGILGAGRSSISFPGQLKPYFNDIFSTCLTTSAASTSQVVYGAAAVPPVSRVRPVLYTPILTNSNDGIYASYFVSLTSIAVAGARLSIPASAFTHSSPSSGSVLDTGTSFALLSLPAFLPLTQALRQKTVSGQLWGDYYFSDGSFFSPCWTYRASTRWPVIKFSFQGGASVTLQPTDYLGLVESGVVCNLISQTPYGARLNILGALLLKNQLLVWDRKNKRIGFRATDCATGRPL